MDLAFPNSPFKLHQPFAPAGDQPEAIAKLVEGIGDGLAFQTLLGVTGSGKTYTMANVIAQLGSLIQTVAFGLICLRKSAPIFKPPVPPRA